MEKAGRRIAPELVDAFGTLRSSLVAVAVFSFASNLLFFAMPLYLMQVYGRVITSRSTETLLLLTLIVIFAFLLSAVLDDIRSRILVKVGTAIDRLVSAKLFSAMVFARIASEAGSEGEARSQATRDLDSLRQGIAGNLTSTILDLPWAPIFLAAIYLADFWIGFGATLGALLLVGLALLNQRVTRPLLDESNRSAVRSYAMAENALRNTEVLHAMGMESAINRRWADVRADSVFKQEAASARSGLFSSAIRFVRMALQVLIIAAAAVLALEGTVGPGIMFAAMILFQRAIAPIERLVGSWQAFVSARQAFVRVNNLLLAVPPVSHETQLPRLTGWVEFENVSYAPGQSGRPILRSVKLELRAGETIGIIGPSGAGKSTFLKLACGVLSPSLGTVRVDGADLRTWDRTHFGRFVGYLPQDVELFSGTVTDNICRFEKDPDTKELFKAARLANVHELILKLADGYDTQLGEGGSVLSAGQRQRIGLARAIYRMPKLVLLDEPNANLDTEGEAALIAVLKVLKASGASVMIISHRSAGIATADKLLFLRNGIAELFGPRDQVIAQIRSIQQAAADQKDARESSPALTRARAAGGAAKPEEPASTDIG